MLTTTVINCYPLQPDDGVELQNALFTKTGQRTVPSVFIDGKHIGLLIHIIHINYSKHCL